MINHECDPILQLDTDGHDMKCVCVFFLCGFSPSFAMEIELD